MPLLIETMASEKKYWKGFDELGNTPVAQKLAQNEFAEELPVEAILGDGALLESANTSRRDFLKFVGFSTAAATLAACENPIVESIPYVVKPDAITPGIPNYYATSYVDGQDFASVLIKTREGRPIKVEPGDKGFFNSGTTARAQASVLSLYDSARLSSPVKGEEASNWSKVESALKTAVDKARTEGKTFTLLTSSVFSPSTKGVIERMRGAYANFNHVQWDAASVSQKLDVWEALTGNRALPFYDLASAKVIVSIGEDFLGAGMAQQLASDYAVGRKPGAGMSRHYQFESNLSMTGSNADQRVKVKASEYGAALAYLYNQVSGASVRVGALSADAKKVLDKAAKDLVAHKGASVVFSGGNIGANEHLAAAINAALSNIGTTVQAGKSVYVAQGNDRSLSNLAADLKAGRVGALVVWGANPAYAAPGFADLIKKATFSLALTDRLDETASLCTYAAPVPHYLESWNDYTPVAGHYAVAQPTIAPLFDSKPAQEVLMSLLGDATSYKDVVRSAVAARGLSVNAILHDGGVQLSDGASGAGSGAAAKALAGASVAAEEAAKAATGEWEVVFYQKAVGAGFQANNPWLHELPDPISRVTWDNYVTISAADALKLGVENTSESNGAINGSYLTLTVNGTTLERVPAWIQPGQAAGTLGLALGYGRTKVGKVADNVGVNAYSLMKSGSAYVVAKVTLAEDEHEFASVQLGNTMMGRKIVNETTLATFLADSTGKSWNEKAEFHTLQGTVNANEANLWPDHDHKTMHMWNMSIDLNSCIGCGACVVACHIENNVPVVGKDEVRRFRDMHWLRIDRYYSSDTSHESAEADGVGVMAKYAAMEVPSASPEVVFQPVMCQHCNHAPCETVCPVAATTHSQEGLNHMTYNRCIGTRYCANNCPYKVRRFNWFNYMKNDKFSSVNPSQDDLGRMVLNPDVTVRSRGVMEKCSFCIQRIQYAKLEAKKKGEPMEEGAFTTACAQACSTGALSFGDVNNAKSAVAAVKQDARAYHLLEEVGTQPSVFYQSKVRNPA
jgi:molybdopterin-containing oxidoreductase family iron-sulfur binding subunit